MLVIELEKISDSALQLLIDCGEELQHFPPWLRDAFSAEALARANGRKSDPVVSPGLCREELITLNRGFIEAGLSLECWAAEAPDRADAREAAGFLAQLCESLAQTLLSGPESVN